VSANLGVNFLFRPEDLSLIFRRHPILPYTPMKTPRFISAGPLLASVLLSLLPLHLTGAPAKEEVLIDFTYVTVDHTTGEKTKSYEFAWDDWGKHITDLPGKGCLVQSPTNKGVLGENRTMVKFDKTTTIDLVFIIGNANNAKVINFYLEDSDGTVQTWSIPLEELTKGRQYRVPIDLTKCTAEEKPGKKPGMNFKKIATWQIKGDWSEPNIEVLLIKVVAPKAP